MYHDIGFNFPRKLNYSSFWASDLKAQLDAERIRDVYCCGVNTDYCVFATMLDAFYHGYRAHCVEDACASLHGAQGHAEGVTRMRRHFGADSVVRTADLIGK
jgi:nicotinamidase-related amidase